jgi:hypothetical protein
MSYFLTAPNLEVAMARRRFIASIVLLLLTASGPAGAGQTLRAGVASMITPVSAVKYYQQVVD